MLLTCCKTFLCSLLLVTVTPRPSTTPSLPGFTEIAEKIAINRTLVLAFTNLGYAHFADNMLLSLKKAGVHNTLMVALDPEAEAHFKRQNQPVYFPSELGRVASAAQLFDAHDYKQMMRIRLDMLRGVVDRGFHVLFSDVDAVFIKNPFEFYQQSDQYDLELCSDAPYIPRDYEQAPMMVMAGYFYIRAGQRSFKFLSEVLHYQDSHPEVHDQQVMNTILAELKPADEVLHVRILNPLECVNGMNYFSSRTVQAHNSSPFVIQNNWATGAEVKRYRFQEHLLWQLNPPGYYGVREKLRFMTYENVQWPIPGLVRERSALQSALVNPHPEA